MNIIDLWQIVTNPDLYPLFLTFLGGYVMMNVFLARKKVTDSFSELEKFLVAFGIGSLFEYLLFLPLMSMATFWFPSLNNGIQVSSALLFCLTSVVFLSCVIYGSSREVVIKKTKNILPLLTWVVSLLMVSVLIVTVVAHGLYGNYTLALISNGWAAFSILSMASFALFASGVYLIWVFVLRISHRTLIKPVGNPIVYLLKNKKAVRRSLIAVGITVMAAGLIVPLDLSLVLFTPHLTQGKEAISPAMSHGNGYDKILFINVTRGPRNNVSATYRYYALMSTSYSITLPTFRFLSSVYIDNPSNASFMVGQYSPSLPDATDNWKKIYLVNPSNVTYEANLASAPEANKILGLVVSCANYSGDASFPVNLTYWQEIGPIENLKVDYKNLTFTDLENDTWLETHTIEIDNHSNDTLWIPAMEYDQFNFEYVIRNSTAVYQNGTAITYAQLIWPTRLGLNLMIPALSSSNVTMTYLATRNPEPLG
jgi:hypothetical protein